MTNIVQLSKSQGFTRMDNDLYEALIGAELSGRELRVALAIHRLTAGFNVSEARIYAAAIAKLSGIARENVSRIITSLLRQKVIYRHGGSKDPIGFNAPNQWKIDPKNEQKKGDSKTTQSVKTDTSLVSFPTHYKDSKYNTAPDGVVGTHDTPATKPAKPKPAKPKPAKFDPLTAKPENVSADVWAGYCEMREGGKTKFTLRACELIAKKLASLDQVAADAVVNLSVESGWVGIFPERLAQRRAHGAEQADETGVPVDKIIALYHQTCPNLPQVAVESDQTLRAMIVERWRESESHQNSPLWKSVFLRANRTDHVFYMGENVTPRLEAIVSRRVFRALEERHD
tara:strand:+ start:786 stop:1814 length:1029 start_codon:yes stop_codon:yes gene_type:complete